MSSCCPLGWGRCDGKDSRESRMAKPRPGDTLRDCRDPSAALGAPQCLPPPQPRCGPAPSPAHIGCFHGISSLTFLTHPIPRAFPPPPLASALNYNKPSCPLSPKYLLPHQHELLGWGCANTCLPLALSLGSGPVHPILEPWDSPCFLTFPVSYLRPADHAPFAPKPVRAAMLECTPALYPPARR